MPGYLPDRNATCTYSRLRSRELLYTSTPGASAGKLGPFVGDVEQAIDLPASK
jgi:hypothetical protein